MHEIFFSAAAAAAAAAADEEVPFLVAVSVG